MSGRVQPERSRLERARVSQRLALDGPLRPLSELTAVSGASVRGLVRLIREGRSKVYLDAVRDPVRGWLSTPEAVRRFLREVAEKRAGTG